MTTLHSRSLIPLSIACVLLLGPGAPSVRAQETGAAGQDDNREPVLRQSGDIIYLKDENGRPFPVPLNATLKEYLEWRDAQGEKTDNKLPEYSVDSMTLTGTAEDRLVNLEAVVSVRVRNKTGAVTVPLQFNEAVLKDVRHTGAGDLAFNGLKNNTGYEWKLSGEGTHEIRLKLSVPVTRQLSSSRLQLTLPPTAVGSLELEVGVRNAAFKTPARTAFEITPKGDRTAITLIGLTENLDLTWQPAPESRDAHPILQSRTDLETRMTTDHVLLTARQQISASSGSFQQLDVRLPTDYVLQSVKDQENLIEEHYEIADRPGWYRLRLSSPTTGPIALDWTLSLPIPDSGTSFRIDGFQLDGEVRLQSGTLNISELPGYRLQELDRRDLFRTDALPGFSRAFEFFRQPFALILDLQKIQPLYSLNPRYELHVERNSLKWRADLDLSVQRGSVSRISLQWPGWKEARWRLFADEQSEVVADIDVDDDDETILHVVFQEPLNGQSIKLSLEAVKDLTDREATDGVSLQLPRFLRRVVSGESELLITSPGALNVTLLDTGSLETLPDPDSADDVVRRLRIPDSAQPELELSVVPRERIVNLTTQIAAELEGEENAVRVRQSLHYNVQYESIDTLRLRVPTSILPSLSAFDENGNALLTEASEGGTEIVTPVRISLPEKRTGPFTIDFQFTLELPLAAEGSSPSLSLTLPLIQSSEAPAKLTALELGPVLSVEYVPSTNEWQQTEELTYTPLGNPLRQNILLDLKRSQDADVLLTVRQCLHVTLTDAEGMNYTRSDYLLNGSFRSLTLRLPEQHERVSLKLNSQPVPRDAYEINDHTVVLRPPVFMQSNDALEQRLTIETESNEPATFTRIGGKLTCQAPTLMRVDSEPLQPPLQTFWLVKLPYQQHLFVEPEGFTSHSLWQRQGLFWVRVPRKSVEELAEWVKAPSAELEQLLTAGGNIYLFHCFGAKSELVVRSMDRKAVVLAGAGFTLLISFMLLRLPATRNALSLLIIASILAFAGIWYPTSVALLLQPAILGFCLACLATTLDHLFRRPQLPAVVTFEDPTAGSSQVVGLSETSTPLSQLDLGLGSEDPTQMKYREVQEEPMSSHISSGE